MYTNHFQWANARDNEMFNEAIRYNNEQRVSTVLASRVVTVGVTGRELRDARAIGKLQLGL